MSELDSVFKTVSRYFSILSEPIRVRIVHAICQQERTVNDIVDTTGATQTTVSRHLALMYREGVLARRRDGGFVFYIVSDSALAEICRTVCVHVASREESPSAPLHSALEVAEAFDVSASRKRLSQKKAAPKTVSPEPPPVALKSKVPSKGRAPSKGKAPSKGNRTSSKNTLPREKALP